MHKKFGVLCGKNNNLSGGRNHASRGERANIYGTAQAPYKRIGLVCFCRYSPKILGHKTLSALQKYLEVLDEDLELAIATLKF